MEINLDTTIRDRAVIEGATGIIKRRLSKSAFHETAVRLSMVASKKKN